MERIDDLEAFLAIVEKGGQTAAARHLRRSLQSINRSLSALEHSVGVTLIQRTTRHSAPERCHLGVTKHQRLPPFSTRWCLI